MTTRLSFKDELSWYHGQIKAKLDQLEECIGRLEVKVKPVQEFNKVLNKRVFFEKRLEIYEAILERLRKEKAMKAKLHSHYMTVHKERLVTMERANSFKLDKAPEAAKQEKERDDKSKCC